MTIVNNKLEGFKSELRLAIRLLDQGLRVSEPMGDYSPYDLVVENSNGRLLKLQIKTAVKTSRTEDSYSWKACCAKGTKNKQFYDAVDVDYFCIYVRELDVWYIIPYNEMTGKTANVYPHFEKSTGKYEKFIERFDLLEREQHDEGE